MASPALSTDADSADGLLCYCRAGFEPELAAELGERAALAGLPGYARTQRHSGYAQFLGVDGAALARALPFAGLIFARQKLRQLAELDGLDPRDRIGPVMEALGGRGRHGDLVVEHPDSDEARPLAGLARSLGNALRPALRQRGLLTEREDPKLPRLHVCLLAGDHLLLAAADPADSSPWPTSVTAASRRSMSVGAMPSFNADSVFARRTPSITSAVERCVPDSRMLRATSDRYCDGSPARSSRSSASHSSS